MRNIKWARAYDWDLTAYNHARHLFDAHVKRAEIDYKITQADDLKIVLEPTDLLYIDTKHDPVHLSKELALHSDKAKKYIIFHDTCYRNKGLDRAVKQFVSQNKQWEILTECKIDVGFMCIGRK